MFKPEGPHRTLVMTLKCNLYFFPIFFRFFVRSEICERLSELGLYRGEKDHAMSIPVCGRSGDVVEPLLKHQVGLVCNLRMWTPTDFIQLILLTLYCN